MNSEKQSTNLQMTLREVNRVGEGQKNVPKLRFKGYEDAWEQRKLGEVSQIVGGGTPSTGIPEYWDGNIDWYSPVEIGEEIFVSCSQRKITQLGLEKSSAKILPVGTVLFTSRAGIGNTAILEKEGCTNQGFQSIVPKDNELDSYFIFSCSHLLKKYGETKGAGSTFVEISGKQMSLMPLNIPEIKEQKSVGNFFRKLDSIITLHQRKYDALKLMKKTLLSRMFPKNGEDVPEIRFKGFTDAWEQRKLGSEFKKVNERNDGTFGKGHWISVAKMYFQDPEKVQSNNIDTRTYVMRLGDIAFEGHPNNEFQFGRFVANDIGDGVVSELFPVYRHNNQYYNNYWKYAIQQERIMAPIFAKSITSSGNSSNKLDPKHFLRQKIRIATLEEQKNIGDFLAEIDNLITLHQRKLDELKNMKKTLLKQMFV